MHCHARSMA
ncbi:hypothetical protein LINGRAHAP2_LOCUS16286 [Linum grandiflorum]